MATAGLMDVQRRVVRSVLVVDDDERVTTAMARSLGATRTVAIAHDTNTARDIARRLRPDLIIVDLRLGNESGIDTIRILKAELPHSIFALVTGYISTDITVIAVKAGADVVMSKPATGRELLRRVCGARVTATETPSLEQVEAEHISRVLGDCNGNVSEAARRLGIYRSSLQRKLRKRDLRT